jgi:hypothetical protein
MRLGNISMAGLVAAATFAATVPQPANGETAGAAMQRGCQNRAALIAASQKAEAADAVEDHDRYELHRAAAREYYRCAQTIANPVYRDMARLGYVAEMLQTLDFDGMTTVAQLKDSVDMVRRWESTVNDVAASTHSPVLKKKALEIRGTLTKLVRYADAEIAKFEASPSP